MLEDFSDVQKNREEPIPLRDFVWSNTVSMEALIKQLVEKGVIDYDQLNEDIAQIRDDNYGIEIKD